jgi:hypothetical protein
MGKDVGGVGVLVAVRWIEKVIEMKLVYFIHQHYFNHLVIVVLRMALGKSVLCVVSVCAG